MAATSYTGDSPLFLQPLGMFGQFSAEAAGRWFFGFGAFSIPLLLLAPVLEVNPLPASGHAAGLFSLSLVLAISVGLALEFIFGAGASSMLTMRLLHTRSQF